MAYSDTVLSRARARLEQARQNSEEEFSHRKEEIYAAHPRLKEIELQMRATVAQVVTASFSGGDPSDAVRRAKAENLSLQEERSMIMLESGIDESDLEYVPICRDCGGTGYIGERMCSCLKELCRQEQKKELSALLAGKESFDNFRLDYYSELVDPDYGVSPRRVMTKTFELCRSYAKNFGKGAENLLFSGLPGLGKTFLSACIARTVAEGGFSVVYDSAGKLFSDFEQEKFGEKKSGATRKYLECDLLIIDDLGTELVTQFTQSALYQVVNTRLMAGRATIVSTNFTSEELEATYSPQLASRLLGAYRLVPFCGKDIRRMKKD